MTHSIKLLAPVFIAAFIYACGGAQDPVAYNNELMTVINDNEKHIIEMNAAMNAADYAKASEIREAWETDLKRQITQVEGIGALDGDDVLQKGVLEGLNAYDKIVKEDYPKLIDIRANNREDKQEEERAALNNINEAFEKAANAVNQASTAFEKKYTN